MPGVSGVTVVTTTGEHLYPFLPTRLRAHRAPGIPCALFWEDATLILNLARKTRGEIAKLCPAVIARLDRATQYSRDADH
jgi:hypothetical protein